MGDTKEKIEALLAKVSKSFDLYKSLEAKESFCYQYGATTVTTLFGDKTHWDNPNLLWVMVNVDGGGYEEYGNQVGVNRDGKLVWEYQSHCSCNEFEDSSGPVGHGELCLGCDEKAKSYQLDELPDHWEAVVLANLEKIVSRGVTDANPTE